MICKTRARVSLSLSLVSLFSLRENWKNEEKILQKFPNIKARGDIRKHQARKHTQREKNIKERAGTCLILSLSRRGLSKRRITTDDDDDEARRFLGVSSVFRIHRSTTTTTSKRIVDVIERFIDDDDGRRRREREKARFYRRGWCDDDSYENENDDA